MEGYPRLLDLFVEGIARLTSYALTDGEKESIVNGFHRFHERLERMNSSSSLKQLAIESQNRHYHDSHCQHEGASCPQNAIRGLLKAFLVGFGVKCGLEIVPHIISLRLFKRPSLLLSGCSRDTCSFASFLAALIGSYKAILCTMRNIRGGKHGDYTNSLVAGMLAGLISAKLDRSQSRRNAIALYLFSRALQYGSVWLFERWAAWQQSEEDKIRSRWMKRAHSADVVSAMNRRRNGREQEIAERANPEPQLNWGGMDMTNWNPEPKISWSPEVTDKSLETKRDEARRTRVIRSVIKFTRNYAPTALMTFSVTLITYVLVFHTDSIPRSYANLLYKSSGFDSLYPKKSASAFKTIASGMSDVVANTRGIPQGMPTKQYIAKLPYAEDLLPAFDDSIHHHHLACGILHPETAYCSRGVALAFMRGFPFAMKMYVPFNIAIQLIFKRGLVLKNPLNILAKIMKSSARSSLFFSLMAVAITQGPCIFRALLGRDTPAGYIVGGILGGLAVLVELPSRRIELGMYCFLRGLQMAWDVGVKRGLWKNVKHGEVALLSVSMAVLMSIFQNDPTTFGLTYRSIITRIFGKN
ncbi:hypothetical protein EV183_000497 [Coemansia sp. RSA 2336]|nr:hypothetical protein EV183_000497 [Coemansia sp. RSA 2336]